MSNTSTGSMRATKKLIPDLRFLEFVKDGEWVKEEFGDLLDYLQPTDYLVTSTAYDGKYKTPVLTAGKTFILGYTNEREGVFKNNLPVIIFDDFTTASKYVDFPFKAKSSAMKILMAKKNGNIKFFFESMQNINYEVGVHGRHWISIFSKLKVPIPQPKEQQKIASCLSSLDELIAAHNNKLKTLKDHKKGLMQNLFPATSTGSATGETVPKYRFPEFENDGEWVKKKLGDEDVSFFVTSKIDSQTLNLQNYFSTDNMLSDFGGITKATKLPSTGRVTKCIKGDILISNIRPYLKKIWKSDRQGGTSNDVLVFRSGIKVISDFLECIIKNDAFINYVMLSAKGVKMPRGDKDSMMEYSIRMPDQKEQQKIASCLSALDDLITSQTEKIEQLKQHKKGLMQGLFPKIEVA
ncbi:MAG: restriction endonuclease subunit S [Bacteroidetes bacterium]|nr:restriction endonuclease subunit S [Bacteroidota bacterium]